MGDDKRWWWTSVLKAWREEWEWIEWGSLFQRRGKRGMKEWRWAVIRDFGSFTRRGLLADLERPAEIWWGQIAERAGGRGWRGDGRRQKDHRPACGERVRGPKTPIMMTSSFYAAWIWLQQPWYSSNWWVGYEHKFTRPCPVYIYQWTAERST